MADIFLIPLFHYKLDLVTGLPGRDEEFIHQPVIGLGAVDYFSYHLILTRTDAAKGFLCSVERMDEHTIEAFHILHPGHHTILLKPGPIPKLGRISQDDPVGAGGDGCLTMYLELLYLLKSHAVIEASVLVLDTVTESTAITVDSPDGVARLPGYPLHLDCSHLVLQFVDDCAFLW